MAPSTGAPSNSPSVQIRVLGVELDHIMPLLRELHCSVCVSLPTAVCIVVPQSTSPRHCTRRPIPSHVVV